MIGRKKGAIFPWSLIFNIIFKFGANNIIYSFHFYAFDLSCAKDPVFIFEAFVGETKKGCNWLQNKFEKCL